MKRIFGFLIILGLCIGNLNAKGGSLPFEVRFKGVDAFARLVEKAKREGWENLPLGDRMIMVARNLVGTPYVGYTLEIDDRIEAPSVNFYGVDCWTFFEISLSFARMLDGVEWSPQALLDQVELSRYRKGMCTGDYLSRLHYLADWMFDNQQGGLIKDMSEELGGVRFKKECGEMTKQWQQYRYLKANPDLRERMKTHEARISKLPVYHIPKDKVAGIESKLMNGDIIGITSNLPGSFCSHVGLAYRDEKGVLRFMHASSNYKKVVIDKRLSEYLNDFKSHAGILVMRPLK